MLKLFCSPMTIEDLNGFPERDDGDFMALSECINEVKEAIETYPALLFWNEDGPVLAAGIVKEDNETGCVWIITAKNFTKYWKSTIKVLPRYIAVYGEILGVKKIEAIVEKDWPRAKRFAKLIGFEYSSSLNGCGSRQADIYIFKQNEVCHG